MALRPAVPSVPADAFSSTSRDAAATTGKARVSGGHGLHWPQNHELAESSIPDLLAIVSRNALIAVPAERCVVFMYDKSTNLLTAQVSCGGRVISDDGSAPLALQAQDTDIEEEDEELSFHPVMGFVSACFLQRRCLRMQEPNLHKSFHREYDVPMGVVMNSIIAAPVTLHHRTVGVIELVNRIDPELSHAPPSAPSRDNGKGEEETEVKLLRTKSVVQHAWAGFSAKDEQKLIQFTSHVAQLLDNKLRLMTQIESAAKFREEQAKSAMELLEMMNHQLEFRSPVEETSPVPRLIKRQSSIHAVPVEWTREQLAAKEEEDPPPPSNKGLELSDVDMLKVMVGICRTQAVFRGHHLRKVHRLSEALHEHRTGRRRAKSALVIQRATRRFLGRRRHQQRRNAARVIARAVKSYHMRAAIAQRMETKKRQHREQPPDLREATSRDGAHHTLVEQDVLQFRERYAKVIRIQQHFRGHKARKQMKAIVGFKSLTKGLKNIVKLQSILRGAMARKHMAKVREEKRAAQAANVVCLRLAATDSDLLNGTIAATRPPPAYQVSNSWVCLYPLPALANGAAVVANRISPTCIHSTVGPDAAAPGFRHRRLVPAGATPTSNGSCGVGNSAWIRPLSRPLAPSPLASPRMALERPVPLVFPEGDRPALGRLHPEVVFELDVKRATRCPPGVQRADDWLPPQPRHTKSPRRHQHPINEREAEDNWATVTYDPASTRLCKQTGSSLGLPRLVRSNQLQVCFLPAGSMARSVTRSSHDGLVSVRLPKTSRACLPSASPIRRPLTTR